MNSRQKSSKPKATKSAKQRTNEKSKAKPPRKGAGKQQAAASAYSTGQSTFLPDIKTSSTSSRIKHRELLSSIIGSSTFSTVYQFALNPGLASSFPWLSTQAIGWEQYHFNSLRLCYYTRCGTLTSGSVLICPDYDAADSPPDSEQIASSYAGAVEDVPWKDIVCTLNQQSMHPDGKRKFVRQAALSGNLDIKTYDVGQIFCCTVDGTIVNWGKLWIEYDVSLYVPQLPSGGAFGEYYQSLYGVPSSISLLGASPTTVPGSNNIFVVSGELITFLEGGTYVLNYTANNPGGTLSQSTTPLVNGAGSGYNKWLGITGVVTSYAASNSYIFQQMLIAAPQGTTVQFNNSVTGGTPSYSELSVFLVPPGFG
jgi:hypothetical protein